MEDTPKTQPCVDDYDAGLLNDFGGGDVCWWQDYLRAEISRANEHWREQYQQVSADKARLDALEMLSCWIDLDDDGYSPKAKRAAGGVFLDSIREVADSYLNPQIK